MNPPAATVPAPPPRAPAPRARPRHLAVGLVLAAVLVATTILGLAAGSRWIGPAALLEEPLLRDIVWHVRAPRVALALAVGAALGMAGAAMQGYTRNPLADPGLLGVSSGAALGAVVVLYSGLASVSLLLLPLGGLAGAASAVLLLYLIAGRDPGAQGVLLAGIALNALFGALLSLVLNLAPNPFAMAEISYWLLGSVTDRGWPHVAVAAPLIGLGGLLLLAAGHGLRALTLGEDVAASLGIRPAALRHLVLLGSSLAVGASVAVSGVIGFVGLIVPHVLRPLVGPDPARLVPWSAAAGAALLASADLLARILPFHPHPEPRLGVLTAFAGCPLFLLQLARLRRAA